MSMEEKGALLATSRFATEVEAPCMEIGRIELPPTLVLDTQKSAEKYEISSVASLVGSWALLLARWTGGDDIVLSVQEPRSRFGHHQPDAAKRESVESQISVDAPTARFMKRVASVIDELAAHRPDRVVHAAGAQRAAVTNVHVVCDLGSKVPTLVVATQDADICGQYLAEPTSKYIGIELSSERGVLVASICHRIDGIQRATLQAILDSWAKMTKHIFEDGDIAADRLPWISDSQRMTILTKFAGSAARSSVGLLIQQRFEEQASKNAKRIAVSCEGHRLTYEELNARANQLARLLRDLGVGPEARVALYVHRSLEMMIGIMGILKAGAAYVPIDPGHPPERIKFILSDSAPAVLLTQQQLRKNIAACNAHIVELDGDRTSIDCHSQSNVDRGAQQSSNLAYIIYTSGSTGVPKGVMVEHRSVLTFIDSANQRCHFTATDVWTLFHSIAFDFSVLELWGPLLYGGHLVVVPYEVTRVPSDFYSLVCSSEVTVMNQTPSAFQQFIGAQAAGHGSHRLRAIVLGGEALDASSIRSWGELNAGRPTKLFNMYGPTEATVFVTHGEVTRSDATSPTARVSVGTPLANSRIYILDKYLEPLPSGAVGEIYIGGYGVARGYVNRAELTAERFRPDRFSSVSRARMYKTGDLGSWRPDGTIEYIGRNDDQVKIRGFRIELGEIQARLSSHPAVGQAHVIVREDVPGEKRLVAYLIFRDPRGVSIEDLRTHLRLTLPEYMVPTAFVALEEFPLTRNGKLDRRALPPPEIVETALARDYEPPSGRVEMILVTIWEQVLRLERVSRTDNFFELGGHSLLIVQLMERLRAVGLAIDVRNAFRSASLADMARSITAQVTSPIAIPPNLIPENCSKITPDMLPLIALDERQIEQIVTAIPGGAENVQDIYPLLPLQEGMLFHHLYERTSSDIYVMPTVISLSSLERLRSLIAALQCVIDRHDVLRTAVVWKDLERPVQVVCRRASLPVEEKTLAPGSEDVGQINDWISSAPTQVPLGKAPLLRMTVFRAAHGEQCYVVLHFHHLVDDAVSTMRLISEVTAHINGEADALPPPAAYRNHVAEVLALARQSNAGEFFRKKLQDVDGPTTPFGAWGVYGSSGDIEDARGHVSSELCQRMRTQARLLGVTVATLFHAAWSLVLAGGADKTDVVFGSVLLGRMQGAAGAQQALGMFVNTLPLRLRIENNNAKELVEQTQRELVDLMEFEHASLAEALRCAGVTGVGPLFNSVVNFRHARFHPDVERSIAEGIRIIASRYRTNYPIVVSIDDTETDFVLTVQAVSQIQPGLLAEYLLTATSQLIEALESNSQSPVSALRVIPSTRSGISVEHLAHDSATPTDELKSGSSTRIAAAPQGSATAVAPQTDLLRSVAEIWMKVLEISSVEIDDDFFELGGHSLLAMQVAVRLQSSLSIDFPTRLIFDFPTLRGLVAQIDALMENKPSDLMDLPEDLPDDLLEMVAGMSESEVQAMMEKLSNR